MHQDHMEADDFSSLDASVLIEEYDKFFRDFVAHAYKGVELERRVRELANAIIVRNYSLPLVQRTVREGRNS